MKRLHVPQRALLGALTALLVFGAACAPAAQPTPPPAAAQPTTAAAKPTTAPAAAQPTTAATAAQPTTAPAGAAATKPLGPADKVKLQLKWVPQAQFAGYFVALEKGYYTDENLDVTIVPGGPDIVSEQQVANGQADFGVDWVASFLAFRDKGLPLIDVAQIYQSSGLLLVSKKSANITKPEDLKGKNVGVWYGGNEFEFLALMDKLKFDPDKDMNVIKQGFTMDPFLAGQMDAASAMTYNEYQIVLESGVKPEDLNVINYTQEGVGMLEDNLFTTEDMVKNKKDLVQRFVRASIKGWQGAADDQKFAVDSVMKYAEQGSTTVDHQTRMMSEVAKLILPSGMPKDQLGVMDAGRFKTTADIALKFHVINAPADPAKSYTNEFVKP
ncbi:MAG: ABC transporter substrate-binding protein [Chloroflexota bacterium]|nr:ABC transporter substrate-binding protein [Chloroflexota bacterium]